MNAINSERTADVRPQRRRLRKAATDWTCEIFVPDGYGDFEDEGDDNDNDNGDDGGDGNDGGDGYGDGGGMTDMAERAGDYGGDAGHEVGVHEARQPSWSEGHAGLNEGVGAYPYATGDDTYSWANGGNDGSGGMDRIAGIAGMPSGDEPFEESPYEPFGLTGAAPGGGVVDGVYGGSSGKFMDAPEEVVVGEGLGVVGLVEK